jgi:hypothetical protein
MLAAACASRAAATLIFDHLDYKGKSFNREHAVVMKAVQAYYARDGDATHVDYAILAEQIAEVTPNPKHRDRFVAILKDASELDVSVGNVTNMILAYKRGRAGDMLAAALANREDATELLEEYNRLANATSLEDAVLADTRTIDHSNIASIIDEYINVEGALQVYPKALGSRLDGRLRPGHHVTTFAPPETGKTALNITMSCGFAMQGAKVLYAINEDREEDIFFRHVACMTGMPFHEVAANPAKAVSLAMDRGIDNIYVVGMSPGDTKVITALLEKYDPDVVFIDQLINLAYKGDSLTQTLGRGARDMRTLGKRYNKIMIDTCQGADSATDKSVLEMGDIYMSNTEVPAQADVLIGIGGNPEQRQEGLRILSLPKNKISGNKQPVIVRLNESISRYSSAGD